MLARNLSIVPLPERIAASIRERSPIARDFFEERAGDIARMAAEVARRLRNGGCIYTFGRGAYSTDAQHTAVEFVHPVLVGKRALPASDISNAFESSLPALVQSNDVVIGYGPPNGDRRVQDALHLAGARGAYAISLPGPRTGDEHVFQEVVEIVGHVLYESVQVFLEHRALTRDAGASSFLYPFLGGKEPTTDEIVGEITASVLTKAADAERLRERVAGEESDAIAKAVGAIVNGISLGGRLLLFGNGGSSTDATDWAIDCASSQTGEPIPALSLASEPATITAIANDVGREFIFLRQLIAHARPNDVVIALSTSGGSSNVIMALEEARKRGNSTVALLGYDGGEVARRGLADHTIVVRSDYIPRVQEAQGVVYHTMRCAIDWVRGSV